MPSQSLLTAEPTAILDGVAQGCRLVFSTQPCEILCPGDQTIRAAIRERQGTDSLHFPAPVKGSDWDRKNRRVNSREGCILSPPPSPRRDPSGRAGPAGGSCSPKRPKGRSSRAAPGRGQGQAAGGRGRGGSGGGGPFPATYLPPVAAAAAAGLGHRRVSGGTGGSRAAPSRSALL